MAITAATVVIGVPAVCLFVYVVGHLPELLGDPIYEDTNAASTAEVPVTASSTMTPTTPTSTVTPAPPPAEGVPVARIGGENDRSPDALSQWAVDHDLTVEWYSGGTTLTAAFRGLDLSRLPSLCLTTAIEPLAFNPFEAETIAPSGPGGCDGATGNVGVIERCRDLAVYPTAIAITGSGRLFANVQLWEDGRIVTDLSSLESLDAVPPPYEGAALGC